MSFDVRTIGFFDRQVKRLSKKYPSLKRDLAELGESLSDKPQLGTPIGNDCFKVRFKISSKGQGKSGGGRLITHIVVRKRTVWLLTVYDKSKWTRSRPHRSSACSRRFPNRVALSCPTVSLIGRGKDIEGGGTALNLCSG